MFQQPIVDPMAPRQRFGTQTRTRVETPGTLGNSEAERYVRIAMLAEGDRISVVITLGLAKGWKFRCLLGNYIDLGEPTADGRPVTWTFKNAALWRAIKTRGIDLGGGT